VRLEGLGKLKKKIHVIGTRTHDLPACSIVPQPTTLPRASFPFPYSSMYCMLAAWCDGLVLMSKYGKWQTVPNSMWSCHVTAYEIILDFLEIIVMYQYFFLYFM
jgi:hypothetical protein